MVSVRSALVVFTTCGSKTSGDGLGTALGSVPVPVRTIFWGVWLASSLTNRFALRSPTSAGVRARLMLQLPNGVMVAPAQVSVLPHSAACAPLMVSVPTWRSPVPTLVSETSCTSLVVVFTCVTVTAGGASLTAGVGASTRSAAFSLFHGGSNRVRLKGVTLEAGNELAPCTHSRA